MKSFHRIKVMVLLTSLFLILIGFSNEPDYEKIFGDHYKSAQVFINTHKWITDTLKNNGIDPCTGLAVIFPELIRYSSIRDKIETAALQSLYIQYGRYYADFSIGHFQMKPSFAEEIEKEFLKLESKLRPGTDTTNSPDARKARIKRLSSIEGQVLYLCMFMQVMKNNHKLFTGIRKIDELRLLTTAYNHGYSKHINDLERISRKNFFYTGIIPPKIKYNYSDIAEEFRMKYCGMQY